MNSEPQFEDSSVSYQVKGLENVKDPVGVKEHIENHIAKIKQAPDVKLRFKKVHQNKEHWKYQVNVTADSGGHILYSEIVHPNVFVALNTAFGNLKTRIKKI